MRLFRKLPCRGFSRGRFEKESFSINLSFIDQYYNDGEVVNVATLLEKGFINSNLPGGLKILANGEITKKVTIEADGFSEGAKRKLEEKKISFKVVE